MRDVASQFDNLCTLLEVGDGVDKCGEQTRSVLSLFRVCAAVLPLPLLEQVLPRMVYGFTEAIQEEKSKYLSRCRAIVRKLVHRVDSEVLRSFFPLSDLPLLNYVLKMNRRGKRKKAEQEKDRMARMLGSDSDNDSEDEESGAEDGDDGDMAVRGGVTRPRAVRAAEVLSGFPSSLQDLLEDRPTAFVQAKPAEAKGSRTSHKSNKNNSMSLEGDSNDDSDDEKETYKLTITDSGQLVVKEKDYDSASVAVVAEGPTKLGGDDRQAKEGAENKAGKKRLREPGEEYRAKKAGGDVWKKGMLAPHAFIPLDPRMLSKKNKVGAVSAFSSVVKKGTHSISSIKGSSKVKGNRNQRIAARKHKVVAKKPNKLSSK
jgi:ribosomal RNA-processing protein 12